MTGPRCFPQSSVLFFFFFFPGFSLINMQSLAEGPPVGQLMETLAAEEIVCVCVRECVSACVRLYVSSVVGERAHTTTGMLA